MLPLRSRVTALLAVAALAACAETSPLALNSDTANAGDPGPPQIVTVCKIGPIGTAATFSVTATGGSYPSGQTFTLAATTLDNPDGCVSAWQSSYPQPNPDVVHTVTVTELESPGTVLENIAGFSMLDDWFEAFPPANSATVHVNYANGAIIWFKNVEAPDIGGEGCTPGYWKVKQHWDSYPSPYRNTTAFGSVFTNAFLGKTFVQVMSTGGGGIIALGRHTVAAFLNAQKGLDYGLTPQDVVDMFNAAVLSRNYEETKDVFEGLNERGCPLN